MSNFCEAGAGVGRSDWQGAGVFHCFFRSARRHHTTSSASDSHHQRRSFANIRTVAAVKAVEEAVRELKLALETIARERSQAPAPAAGELERMEAEIERLRRELAERPVVRQHTDVHHYHYHITTSSPSSPDDNDDDNNNNMPPAASGPRPNPEHSRRARIGCIYVGVGSLHHQDAPRCKAHRYGSSVYGGCILQVAARASRLHLQSLNLPCHRHSFAPADMAPRGPASLRPVLPGNVGGPWRLTRESQFHIKKFESDDAVIPAKAMLMPFDDDNDAAEEINADVELERESSERLSPEQEPCGKTTVAVEGGC